MNRSAFIVAFLILCRIQSSALPVASGDGCPGPQRPPYIVDAITCSYAEISSLQTDLQSQTGMPHIQPAAFQPQKPIELLISSAGTKLINVFFAVYVDERLVYDTELTRIDDSVARIDSQLAQSVSHRWQKSRWFIIIRTVGLCKGCIITANNISAEFFHLRPTLPPEGDKYGIPIQIDHLPSISPSYCSADFVDPPNTRSLELSPKDIKDRLRHKLQVNSRNAVTLIRVVSVVCSKEGTVVFKHEAKIDPSERSRNHSVDLDVSYADVKDLLKKSGSKFKVIVETDLPADRYSIGFEE